MGVATIRQSSNRLGAKTLLRNGIVAKQPHNIKHAFVEQQIKQKPPNFTKLMANCLMPKIWQNYYKLTRQKKTSNYVKPYLCASYHSIQALPKQMMSPQHRFEPKISK
jgi:hypothetical protein